MASVFKNQTGDWTDAGNWNTGIVPGDEDAVTIAGAASVVLVNTTPDSVSGIDISAGTIRIGADATLETDTLAESGTGGIIFTGNGILQIDESVSTAAAVDFGTAAVHGTVVWNGADRATLSDLTLRNFYVGDALRITVTGTNTGLKLVYTGSATAGTVTITRKSGKVGVVQVSDPVGSLSQSAFSVRSGSGYVELDTSVACFLRGTRIATPRGEVAVEALRIGDVVATAGGGAQPVRWIGSRGYVTKLVPAERRAALLPIRIAAGALGAAVPIRDLFVSPEHMMAVGDVLVPAGKLLNGTSITQVENLDVVQYFHIELPRHVLLYADGALAESYRDTGNRNMFANVLAYLQLGYDADAEPPPPCRTVVSDGAALQAVHAALAIAASSGLAGDRQPAHEAPLRSA
jgi:hypothetical protein